MADLYVCQPDGGQFVLVDTVAGHVVNTFFVDALLANPTYAAVSPDNTMLAVSCVSTTGYMGVQLFSLPTVTSVAVVQLVFFVGGQPTQMVWSRDSQTLYCQTSGGVQ